MLSINVVCGEVGTESTPRSMLPWYALKVRTRSEPLAAAALRNRGYQTFSPTFRERRRCGNAMKLIEKAVFPGYIFCKFDTRWKVPILSSPAVEYIVSSGGT